MTFIRHGNMLYIAGESPTLPAPPQVFSLLHSHLAYDHKEYLFGWRARDPKTGKKRRVEVTTRRLYGSDGRSRLYTGFGFLSRCHKVLKSAGFSVAYSEIPTERPRPNCYEPDLGNVCYHFEFRARQDECLAAIAKSQHGVVHAITGFGKMVMGAMTALYYPQARVHITVDGISLVNQWVEFLTKYIPNVGQFGGGRKCFGDRVTVFSIDSLHHSDFDSDICIIDEAHSAVTDENSKALSQYQTARMFGFTATPKGRSDGSDPRIEYYFGPTIFYLPYWEGVELNLVVPIRVEWRDVFLDHNPAAMDDDIQRKRRGIWFNDARNDIIAEDINAVAEDEQFLVLTDTIFHAIELYRRVKKARKRPVVLVYDKIDTTRFAKYKDLGDLPPDLEIMTAAKKEHYRKQFAAGEIDAVATKTWETGIDPIYLQHLFVASSFSSPIKAQQGPGRASRINKAGKDVGIVHDYRDQFDDGFREAARKRYKVYESMRWEQVVKRGNEFVPVSG